MRPRAAAASLALLAATMSATLSGCANLGQVQAFEKGYLAKEAMTFGGDPLETRFLEHVYTSKENASGGTGVGGGGCGCN